MSGTKTFWNKMLEKVGIHQVEDASKVRQEREIKEYAKYYPQILEAMASGMGGAGGTYKVFIDSDVNGRPYVNWSKKEIHIPALGESPTFERVVLTRGFIDHELGHVRNTDGKLYEVGNDNLLFACEQIMEDKHSDTRTIKEYPGSKKNLGVTFDLVASKSDFNPFMPLEINYVMDLFKNLYAVSVLGYPPDLMPGNVFSELLKEYVDLNIHSSEDSKKYSKKLCDDIRQIVKGLEFPDPPKGPSGGMSGESDGDNEDENDSEENEENEDERKDDKEKFKSSGKKESKEDKGNAEDEENSEREEKSSGKGGNKEEDKDSGADEKDGKGDKEHGKNKSDKKPAKSKLGKSGRPDSLREAHKAEQIDHTPQRHTDGKLRDEKPKSITLEEFNKFCEEKKPSFDISEKIKNQYKGLPSEKTAGVLRTYTFDDSQDRIITPKAKETYDKVDRLLKETQQVQGHLMATMVRMYKQERPLPTRRQQKGIIDTEELYRVPVGDKDIFIRKQRQEVFDIAFELLLDLSGSMHGERALNAIKAALVFGQVLDNLNIPFEIIGFSTHGYNFNPKVIRSVPLNHIVFKTFNEKMNWITYGRFEEVLAPTGESLAFSENVDGEAVLWAGERLSERHEQKRILIAMSDGQPACGVESHLLYEHLKWAINELTKKNIQTIGLGIQTSSVSSFYKNYAVMHSLSDLPTTLLGKVEEMLIK